MTDVALTFNGRTGQGDLCIADGDLVLDRGLSSLALMSLLTDARAIPRDAGATSDLRGWWGDAIEGRPLGSRIWTLAREKSRPEVLRRVEDMARQALRWMIDDGIAGDIEVSSRRVDSDGAGASIEIDGAIVRANGSVEPITLTYDLLWRAMK